jgi:phytoene/squalene synthetase
LKKNETSSQVDLSANLSADLSAGPFAEGFDPLALDFSPSAYAADQSHFQISFLFVWSKSRKTSLSDLYAFCRLADDIADCEGLEASTRRVLLESLRAWVRRQTPIGHPFWDRFLEERRSYAIPDPVLEGILTGVSRDFDPKPFETWGELDSYVYEVACCVGEAVLCILGAAGNEASEYAWQMGRALQYLNIMRDLQEDRANGRSYIPQEFMRTLKNSEAEIFLSQEKLQLVREEFYKRAIGFRYYARPYSWRCLIAELMAGLYFHASARYWRFGNPKRLSFLEKFLIALSVILQFSFWRKSLWIRSATPAPSSK